MSLLKYTFSLQDISKNFRRVLFVSNKSLCSKKVEDLNAITELDQSKDEKKKTDGILFEEDDEVGTVVVTEREKDASVTTKLSKECNNLIFGKNTQVMKIKDGFKLTVAVDDNQYFPIRDTFLDQAVKNVPKDAKKPATQPATKDKVKEPIKKDKTKEPTKKGKAKESIKKDKPLDKTTAKLKKPVPSTAPPKGKPAPPPPPPPPPPRKGAILRQEEPGEVILAFIPREWFTAFFPLTGVTGFGTFLFTTAIFLISKEYYVLEHNYYGGLSVAIMVWGARRYVGPGLSQFLDKEIKAYEDGWIKSKQDSVDALNKRVKEENRFQFQADGNLMLVDAKRENVQLQLENEFRKRQMTVYNKVKHKLDYHAAVGDIHRKIQQKNLVDYVSKEVLECMSEEQIQTELIEKSINNLISELKKAKEGAAKRKGDEEY